MNKLWVTHFKFLLLIILFNDLGAAAENEPGIDLFYIFDSFYLGLFKTCLFLVEYDPEKIFSFAGFNEPPPKGTVDVRI